MANKPPRVRLPLCPIFEWLDPLFDNQWLGGWGMGGFAPQPPTPCGVASLCSAWVAVLHRFPWVGLLVASPIRSNDS